jgi:PAS domain S-box-containing protein
MQKDEMWERTFDAVPDLIMILDNRHKIIRANKVMAERLGKSPKDLVGLICYEIVHDTKEPPAFCPHARLLNDGKEHSSDAHEERLGGDFLITVSPLHDSYGSLIGSVHIARDITELKRSEKVLLESEKKFRNLADQSPNMIFINTKGKIVYVNKKCEELMGYTKNEFYSPNFDFRKLIASESQKTISNAFKKHMDGEDVEPYEYALITKDGRTLSVINAPKLITFEGEDAILGVVTDITDRVQMENALRKSEEALRKSEQEYRAIFENTGAASLIIEEDTTISLVNAEFEKLAGYSKEEIEGEKSWAEFILPKDFEKLKKAHEERRINPDTAPKHHEIGFIDRQGEVRHAFVTVDMIPETGKSVASALDISDLKQAEKALKESEQRYRMLAENSADIIYILDENLRRTYVSPSVERVLGYTPEEHLKHERKDYYTPESLKLFQNTIKEKLEQIKSRQDAEEVIKLELNVLHKDGSPRWIETRAKPIYDDKNNFKGIIGVSRDITERIRLKTQLMEAHDKLDRKVQIRTKELVIANEQLLKEIEERKRVEQDLKNKEQSLAEAQRIAHLGNWDWNIVTNELFWSDEIYRIFGLTPQEFGATYDAFLNSVHPDDRELVDRAVDMALSEDKPYSIDHRILLPDGSEHIVHEQAEVMRDDTGQAIRMAGTVQDITERKKTEADARQLREELTHVSRVTTIGTLAGALAHEINQPLTAIMSNAQAALRFLDAEKPNLDELREILSDIADDTIRSSDVIHQLRDFMKKGEIEVIPLNINEIIKEVVNLTHRDTESRNISVRIDTNEDLPEVMGDKVQLQQVILNLVINGFDAMMYQDAGSRELVIQTEQDEDNSIHVAVQDTGMGIEEEKLEQIFEPFVSTKPEGMGLGLSINQYIINAHNGRMWATNNPDHGATVHFTLPIKK